MDTEGQRARIGLADNQLGGRYHHHAFSTALASILSLAFTVIGVVGRVGTGESAAAFSKSVWESLEASEEIS